MNYPSQEYWNGKNVFVTGITGFVGSHIAEKLLSMNANVSGIVRRRSSLENIEPIKHKVKLIDGDISDSYSVYAAMKEAQPEVIFHLAAQSFVPLSWSAPLETIRTNIDGTLNVLEAIRKVDSVKRIQFAGSSEEYGHVLPEESPVKESQPLRPLSPYGVSKVACDLLCYQYGKSYNLGVIRTRTFNHTGPKRGKEFVTSNFAHQVASIMKGKGQPVIKVGNLDAVRDFTDVRDIVNAYMLAIEKARVNEVYNIGSGTGVKIQDVLNMLIRLSNAKVDVVQDTERIRPSDVQYLLCDSSKFRNETGWQPTIPFEKTMSDLLQYWIERV